MWASFGDDDHVLQLTVGTYNSVNILKSLELHFKWVNCMMYGLFLKKVVIKNNP